MDGQISPRLPGRIGHPRMALRDDPRADPRMLAAMAPFGMAGHQPPPPVDRHSSLEALLAFCDQAETAYGAVNDVLTRGLPAVPGVATETHTIQGADGDDIALHIARPADHAGPLPGILHLHGGGMVLMSATGPLYARWRAELAATGLVVVGVEFRNAGGRLGPYPFPAGLNDCASGRWQPHARDRPQGQTRRTPGRRRRRLRAVSLHLERVRRGRSRSALAGRERRIRPELRADGVPFAAVRSGRQARPGTSSPGPCTRARTNSKGYRRTSSR